MNWYYVPVVGLIKAGVEFHRANKLFDVCMTKIGTLKACLGPFQETLPALDNLDTALLFTGAFMAVAVCCFIPFVLLPRKAGR